MQADPQSLNKLSSEGSWHSGRPVLRFFRSAAISVENRVMCIFEVHEDDVSMWNNELWYQEFGMFGSDSESKK